MLYEYICDACQKLHEIQKKLADYKRTELCPDCKGEMRRIISASPVTFGPGFFGTGGYTGPSNRNGEVTFKYKNGKKERVPYNPKKVPGGTL